MRATLAVLLLCLIPTMTSGISPTRSQHQWVAGTGEAGNIDGPFMVARFNKPRGILHDKFSDRLIIADSGNHSLRTVALADKNTTSTLHLTISGTTDAFTLEEPSLLAWKDRGKLLYCLDRKKPGVAVIDINTSSGRWLPLPLTFTGKAGEPCNIATATALHSQEGKFATLSFKFPNTILLFDLPNGETVTCSVSGVPEEIDDLYSDKFGFWTLNRNSQSIYRLDPIGTGPDWFDIAASPVTPTSSFPDFAVSLSITTITRPWSFVRSPSSTGLKIASDSPYVMTYLDDNYRVSRWAMLDQHGKKIGIENDVIFGPDRTALHTRENYHWSIGAKQLFYRPEYLCDDAEDDRWYLSETDSHRIVSFTRSMPDESSAEVSYDGIMDTRFPYAKKRQVWRTAVFSACYFKEAKTTNRKMDTFSKRLQWYLNLFSSLKGEISHEVMFFGATISPQSSLTNDLQIKSKKAVIEYEVDEILIAMRPRDLAIIVQGYQNWTLDADGLPDDFDPEYMVSKRTWEEVSKNPAYLELLRYMEKHPDEVKTIQANGPNINVLDHLSHWPDQVKYDYRNENYLNKIFKLHIHDMRILKKRIDKMAEDRGRPVKITFALFPERSSIGPQERLGQNLETGSLDMIRSRFKTMCSELGAGYIDLVDEMRVYALDQPFVEVADSHMTSDGADLTAIVAAYRYLQLLEKPQGKPEKVKPNWKR